MMGGRLQYNNDDSDGPTTTSPRPVGRGCKVFPKGGIVATALSRG